MNSEEKKYKNLMKQGLSIRAAAFIILNYQIVFINTFTDEKT